MRHSAHLIALTCLSCGVASEPAPAPMQAETTVSPSGFAGSASCAGCHEQATQAWSGTHHALAERAVSTVAASFPDPSTPTITLDGGTGPTAHAVARIIGVEPLWLPLIAQPGGRLQTSSQAYDPAKQAWFSVFDDAREPGEWGHWTGGGMTWNSQCAACHDTGVDKAWDATTNTYATTFHEMGVACEACHGPSAPHAADPDTPTAAPHGRQEVQATCESCHIRWTPATDAYVAGDPLLQHGLPALPGLDPGFQADGAVVDESFEAIAFRSSRMHAAGVRCVDCHDAHTTRLKAPGSEVCASCHAAVPEHGHHEGVAPAPTCLDCHMPVTTYMARDPRHDHGFRVPDPALDAELGQSGACSRCHDDDVSAQASTWWPVPRDRSRTRAIHAAMQGEDASAALDAAWSTETHPLWRAVLLGLRTHATEDRKAALSSPDAWLRRAAVTRAPADAAWLVPALRDPVRAVRLEAASALQPRFAPDAPQGEELRQHLERLGDHASAAFTLGSWWAGHGRHGPAQTWLQRTVDLDPASAEAWRTLAISQSAAGRPIEAATTLAKATTKLPHDAELHFLRGLALSATGGDAIASFRAALAADPTYGRAAYNLALALHSQGDPEGLTWLRKASDLLPGPDAPYALATIAFQAGDLDGARTAIAEALRRDPTHPASLILDAQLNP